jgi:hypothetical protein
MKADLPFSRTSGSVSICSSRSESREICTGRAAIVGVYNKIPVGSIDGAALAGAVKLFAEARTAFRPINDQAGCHAAV